LRSAAERGFVRIRPLDELDDLPLPAPLRLIRFCGAPGCRRRARRGGRHCSSCHAAAVRRYRDEHHRALAVRRRDAAAARNDDARARDAGRAKLAMALRRGTLKRGRCRECGAREVVGLIADPAEWRAVVWVCREHRAAGLERRREVMERHAYEAKQAVWYAERAQALAAIELLPSDEQARVRALAARGLGGMRLSPDAPLYVMNLVRAYEASLAH